MQINASQSAGWTVLALNGKIDEDGSKELKSGLAAHIGPGSLALDFSGVEYVTSQGFRVLLQAYKDIRAAKGKLVLGNMTEPVRRFFDIAGLSSVFTIAHDIKDVVGAAR